MLGRPSDAAHSPCGTLRTSPALLLLVRRFEILMWNGDSIQHHPVKLVRPDCHKDHKEFFAVRVLSYHMPWIESLEIIQAKLDTRSQASLARQQATPPNSGSPLADPRAVPGAVCQPHQAAPQAARRPLLQACRATQIPGGESWALRGERAGASRRPLNPNPPTPWCRPAPRSAVLQHAAVHAEERQRLRQPDEAGL